MSLERARKTFNLEPVEGGFALSEYIVHPEFLKKVSGMDPFKFPRESHAKAYKELGVDFVAVLPDAAIGLEEGADTLALNDEGAKTTRWGTGPGSVWVSTLPFKTVDEVLEYDPFSCKAGTYPYGMAENPHKSVDEIAAALQRNMESQWEYSKDDFMIAGGNYFVLFHYFVSTFGYDLFCDAAYMYPDQFRKLLEKFVELSHKIYWHGPKPVSRRSSVTMTSQAPPARFSRPTGSASTSSRGTARSSSRYTRRERRSFSSRTATTRPCSTTSRSSRSTGLCSSRT